MDKQFPLWKEFAGKRDMFVHASVLRKCFRKGDGNDDKNPI